uniref:Uncharacterized protein n=1 Tax=Romanomermis culicivorax TaxID=13658 RepID=A0A915KJ95_ROMCU
MTKTAQREVLAQSLGSLTHKTRLISRPGFVYLMPGHPTYPHILLQLSMIDRDVFAIQLAKDVEHFSPFSIYLISWASNLPIIIIHQKRPFSSHLKHELNIGASDLNIDALKCISGQETLRPEGSLLKKDWLHNSTAARKRSNFAESTGKRSNVSQFYFLNNVSSKS